MVFGYYDEGDYSVRGTADTYDAAVSKAVESGHDLSCVLVGPMRDVDCADLLGDADDFAKTLTDLLEQHAARIANLIDPSRIVEAASERLYETVEDGHCDVSGPAAKAYEALHDVIAEFFAARVVALDGARDALDAWAREYLDPDPSTYCDGDRIPTEYVEGEWVVAGEHEAAAVITYAAEPSPETGHVGWCWWARGKMGDAPSYEAAKAAAEAVIARET